MKKSPGDIYDAYVPNYDAGMELKNRATPHVRSVASKIQKILVLGGSEMDYYCLPIVPKETSASNLPVGAEGYTNPLQMIHVGHHHFRFSYQQLPLIDYEVVRDYTESLYTFLIEKGCNRARWANVPIYEFWQERFSLKSRPCIALAHGLHLPVMTNHGRYTASGPVVSVGEIPGKVGDAPLFLPDSFLYGGRGVLLPSNEKSQVQEYLTQRLPEFFQCQP